MRRSIVVAATCVLALLPLSATTAQDLDAVVEQRETIQEQLDDATFRLEDLHARMDAAEDEREAQTKRADDLRLLIADTDAAMQRRARAQYTGRGVGGQISVILSSGNVDLALSRARYLDEINARELGSLEAGRALRDQLEQTEALLADREAELAVMAAEFEELAAGLTSDLTAAKAVEQELRTRAERQQMIARGRQKGLYACIFQGPHSFINSWGFARSGGRRHKGTDVMAGYRAQVYAFTTGRVTRMKAGGIGGIVLYLQGDDGVRYYYAHLDGYAPGISVGKRVEAGQLIAYNGSTGNASASAPHVHFEVNAGAGSENPYPWLRAVC